jgi:hypothetical protein
MRASARHPESACKPVELPRVRLESAALDHGKIAGTDVAGGDPLSGRAVRGCAALRNGLVSPLDGELVHGASRREFRSDGRIVRESTTDENSGLGRKTVSEA